jgi:integrase/recombinase XerD
MDFNEKDFSEVVDIPSIEEFLYVPKNFSQNGISTNSFSPTCIISKEMGKNTESRKKDQERAIDILVQKIYPIKLDKNVENRGRKAINDWIFENIVLQELANRFVISFFYSIKHLDPWTFLLVTQAIEEYVQYVARHFGYNEINKLTLNELANKDVCHHALNKVHNKVKKEYIVSFFNFLSPNDKIRVKTKVGNKESFQHPLVKYCEAEMRKNGVKDASIKFNLTAHIHKHFRWICSLKEFEGYGINNIVVNQIRQEHLLMYKNYIIGEIKEGKLTKLFGKRHLQYVKRFYTLLYSKNKITKNIAANITNIAAEEYIYRELPSPQQLQEFFDVVQMYSNDPVKERLAFLLMTHMGFRIKEVSQLQWQDINIDNKTISIMGKGDHCAILPIPKIVLNSLQELSMRETGYVFSYDTKQYYDQIYQNYKLYSMIAGWEFKGGPHLLRHLYLTNLAKHCELRVLKILSRHKSTLSVSKYIHIDSNRLTEAVNSIEI